MAIVRRISESGLVSSAPATAEYFVRRIDEVRLRAAPVTVSISLTGDQARISASPSAGHLSFWFELPLAFRRRGRPSGRSACANLPLTGAVTAPIAFAGGFAPLRMPPTKWRAMSTTPIGALLPNALAATALRAANAMRIDSASALSATATRGRIVSSAAAGIAFTMPGQRWRGQGKTGRQYNKQRSAHNAPPFFKRRKKT
jgi:hypothetical protein